MLNLKPKNDFRSYSHLVSTTCFVSTVTQKRVVFQPERQEKEVRSTNMILAAVYKNCVDILIFCTLMVTWFKHKLSTYIFLSSKHMKDMCVLGVFLWLPDLKAIFKEVVSDW